MVPTYFRRELRDRVLQRPLRLRALFLLCRFASSNRRRLRQDSRHIRQRVGRMAARWQAPAGYPVRCGLAV